MDLPANPIGCELNSVASEGFRLNTSDNPKRDSWLANVGIIAKSAYVIGVPYYVAFTASDFTLFQKLVVLLIAAILYGAARAIVHVAGPGRR